MAVKWLWSGANTSTTIQVTVALTASAASCRLVYSTNSGFSSQSFGSAAAPNVRNYVKLALSGLTANTHYYYRVEIDGVIDTDFTGQFKTLPTEGVSANFQIAYSTCNTTGSDYRVFDGIAARQPIQFLHLGDKHYGDIAINDEQLFRDEHEANFAITRQKAMHQVVAVNHMWDDHDYGANDSDRTSPSRAASRAVFGELVPTYPLNETNAGVYQSWYIGRVLVIMTDNRYHRDPNSQVDSATKTMIGSAQKTWLKSKFLEAAENDTRLIIWANTQMWSLGPNNDGEHWGKYEYEKGELVDYMNLVDCPQVVQISGDLHNTMAQIAYRKNGRSFPILQAAPLDSGDTLNFGWRGGEWDVGPTYHRGVYATVDIEDNGSDILRMSWKTRQVNQTTGVETVGLTLDIDFMTYLGQRYPKHKINRRLGT